MIVHLMDAKTLFEEELLKRGHKFNIEEDTGLYCIEQEGMTLRLNLENLAREYAGGGMPERVSQYLDHMLSGTSIKDVKVTAESLYWSLESNNHGKSQVIRIPVSEKTDRVLVRLIPELGAIVWVDEESLQAAGLLDFEAEAEAYINLDTAAHDATVGYSEIDGIRLGYLNSSVPFTSSLILAPNFRALVEPVLGWPVYAVTPTRDIVFIWYAGHKGFEERVGPIVVQKFLNASYPISTEVYEITDGSVRVAGEFATNSAG
ncbi:hypothetical protein BH11VER1_BH11VER1_33440 [soil metagenome]